MRGTGICLALVGVAVTAFGGYAAAATGGSDPLIEQKRAQVERAREQDLFFWERYLRRLDSPAQFPQPDSFYVPGQLIEGRASAPLPRREPAARSIREQHWRGALHWAKEHESDVLVVARSGAVEFEHYGPGHDSGSLLPVRSIAKSLAALAVGAAIADGAIRDVRQPLGAFLQPWRDDPRGRITLEQLLTMSSGLQAYSLDSSPASLSIQLAEGSNVRDVALAYPLVAEPGTRFGWGNVESQLLALAVEAATGQSYRDYLQSRIWKPMELGTASFNVDRDGRTRAFCCLRLRADDLLKIGIMLLDGGEWQGRRILPREWVAQMFAPSAINPYHGYQSFLGWTLGEPRRAERPLIVRNDVPFSEPAWYLSGYGGTTTLWLMPCSGTAILRFGNDPKEWETSTIPNLLLTGAADPRTVVAPGTPAAATSAGTKLWDTVCNGGQRR